MFTTRTQVAPVARLLALLALLAPADVAADDGFKPLFNGKDFTGWILPAVPGLFTVEGDEIVGRTGVEKLKKNVYRFAVEKEFECNIEDVYADARTTLGEGKTRKVFSTMFEFKPTQVIKISD